MGAEIVLWSRSITKVFDSPISIICDVILAIVHSINKYVPMKIAFPLAGLGSIIILPLFLVFLLFLIPLFIFTLVIFPIIFIFIWIVVSQESFETKIMSPLLSWSLKHVSVRKILTVDM